MHVPFFRVELTDDEIGEVVSCLKSGWLTTGERTKQFETAFASFVGGSHAVAVNSCTAALHLAVEALGLTHGQAVLVPTLTFAATGEIIRYQGAVPILVDCDPETLNMDLADAERKLTALREGRLPFQSDLQVVGIIPVHVGGQMVDMQEIAKFADRHGLWVVEDAAHALPAAMRSQSDGTWIKCGQATAAVTCFSFYANKTITTGEGGMAVTNDEELAARIRTMSLHGLSNDAWKRFTGTGSWDYRILAPGYKYNLTDIASSLGIHQLARAETMRRQREALAVRYQTALADCGFLDCPSTPADRLHSWHLFPVRLQLEQLAIDRDEAMSHLKQCGVGCSVHWRPLHLHPYYEQTYGWQPEHFPVATAVWRRLISLPLFPAMQESELQHVVRQVRGLDKFRRQVDLSARRAA